VIFEYQCSLARHIKPCRIPKPTQGTVHDVRRMHASELQGRPISVAINDAERAGLADLYIQMDDLRLVVRGPGGREHIFSPDGKEIITSVRRSQAAHNHRLRSRKIRRATAEEFQALKEVMHGKQQ
jgi:hypothetical protein